MEVCSLSDLDPGENSMYQYFVGLDVHKQVITYCIKAADGTTINEGSIKGRCQPELPP
jgi:hypothetical protein